MHVEIGELQSVVRTGFGDPQTVEKLMRRMMELVDERDAHKERVKAEQKITAGVSHEQEESA